MKKMEGERPHRSGSSSSELFICFTSRPSSSSNTSSMKISSKSILSPGRTDKLREGVTTLPSSLSRRLRSNGSMKGGQSSPMFPTGSKKKGCAFETPEPSSPKVTCIGQVRVKTKKQGKKMRTRSKRRGGDGSFRKTEQIQEGQQQQQQECLPNRNQRWVHLPLSICEALRAFGAEFNCFVPCGGRSSCSSNAGMVREKGEKRAAAPAGGTPPTSSCGAVFAKWLMALQESEEGKRREIGGEMVGIVGAEDEEEKERVEEKKGEEKAEVEIEEEEEEVNVCIPPRNALLLMRCRSEPLRMSSLANRFWDSPAQKVEENEDRNEEEEDEDDDEEEHDYEEAVEEEQQIEGEAKQKEDETLEKAVSAEEDENTEEEEEEYGEAQEQKEADEEEERVENGSSGVSLEEQEKPQEDDKGKEEAQLQKQEEEGEGEKEEEETQLHKTEEEEKETQLRKIEEEKETQLQKTEEVEKETQLQKTEEVEKEIQLQKTEEEEETHLQKTKEEEQRETQLHKTEEGEEEEEEEREEKMVEERRSSCSTASVQLEKEEEGAEAVLEEERSTEEENEKTEVITGETTESAAAATAAESEEEKSTVEEKRMVEGREERERALQLPDCLLLMMCEPKLSMEVSRETWVCSTDFLRCRPDKGPAPPPPPLPLPLPPPEATGKRKEGAADDSKRVSTDSNPAHPPPANPAPQQPLSMATVIEQKLVNAVAYEPFVLTRCKSEPVRSSARLAPEACFWKSRKLPPHQPPVGVGAAGVGF